jgi:hypothetical protein
MIKSIIRNVDKITSAILRSYFSFFQGEKAANGVALTRPLKIIMTEVIMNYLKIFQRRKNGKEQAKWWKLFCYPSLQSILCFR